MGSTSATQREYKAVRLEYDEDAETARDTLLGRKRGIDLSPVNELAADGWEVHTFSYDEDGCWNEAIMVKEVSE